MAFGIVAAIAGPIIGGLITSGGASDAANAQIQAANTAAGTQLQIYNQQRQDLLPWRQVGTSGLNALMYGMGLGQLPPETVSQVYGGALPVGATSPTQNQPQLQPSVQPPSPQYVPGTNPTFISGVNALAGFQNGAQPTVATPSAVATPSDVAAYSLNRGEIPPGVIIPPGSVIPGIYSRYPWLPNSILGLPGAPVPGAPVQPSAGATGGSGLPTGGVAAGEFSAPFGVLPPQPADIANDPGYKFRMEQGMQALERSAAARGGLLSGGTLKDLATFSQGTASQEYQNAYARYNDLFNRYQADLGARFGRLSNIAGLGQNANNTSAQIAQNYGNNVAGIQIGAGNAVAASTIAGANALAGGVQGGFNGLQQWNMMQNLFGGSMGLGAAPAQIAPSGSFQNTLGSQS